MEGYEITTAHNVKLTFGYASLGDRVLAYLIDTVIKFAYIFVAVIAGAMLAALKIVSSKSVGAIILLVIVCMVPFVFYSLFFEYFTGGQTPGKRALNIKVTSQDSTELTFGKCLIRWLFRFVDFSIFSGVIAMVTVSLTDRKQRVGDLVAGTIVVSMKTTKTLDQTLYAYVEPDRKARYPQVARLTAREVEVVKEVIRIYEKEDNYDLVPATAARIRKAIGTGDDLDDLSLLKAVVEDYYTLAAQ